MDAGSVAPLRDYLNDKRKMMASLGARLLDEQPGVAETATAVMMRSSGEYATLKSVAGVVSQALTKVLGWAVWWGGLSDKHVRVALNNDLFAVKAQPQELLALLQLWQAGGISYQTFYQNLLAGNVARQGVDADEERAELEREEPATEPPVDLALAPEKGLEPNKIPGNDNHTEEREVA